MSLVITQIHLLLHFSIIFVASLFLMLCMNATVISSASQMVPLYSNTTMVNGCIETERQSLLNIKRGFVDIHGLLSSWGSPQEEDCCQWTRVGCDIRTGHVTHLYLSDVSYGFTYSVTYSVSNVSHSLLELKNLIYLDLSWNAFGKRPIPKFVGSLSNLDYLDLSHADFGGAIPHELGNLSKLNHLDLGYNLGLDFGSNFGWLFHLSSLTHLDLSYIYALNDWGRLIQRLPSLSVLRLNYCNLNTTPSSFSTNYFPSISTLDLSWNLLPYSIFDWLSNLSGSLVDLDLSGNQLEGNIPDSLAYMTSIKRLDLSWNNLDGVVPTNSFRNLSSLQFLYLRGNNLSGKLEDILHVLPEDSLQVLVISGNKLTGSLTDITRFSSLTELDVSYNQLNGYLPQIFQHKSVLQSLDLSNNSLKGCLPSFTGFPDLGNLSLCNNKLFGSLPDFTGLQSLSYLNLAHNEFSGSLPDFSGCLSLNVLNLCENQLTEWKTQSIGQLTNLNFLDLSMNSIGSTISEIHLFNLSNLKSLDTSFNSLTFNLSSEWLPPFQIDELVLGSCKLGPGFPNWIRNQENIHTLDFSNSQISDTIPTWFWNVSSTRGLLNLSSNSIRGKCSSKLFNISVIDLSSNYLEGPIPPISPLCSKINLSHNRFLGTLFSLTVAENMFVSYLDLSHNLLFGALPDRWVYFQTLAFLNLGYNNLSGTIPMSMGHLVSLQTLILRNNSFYGELPVSLRNCGRLGFVDFGLNNLSGYVPAWIGEYLPLLYALILRSNKFYGTMPYELCHLSDLHFLDLSLNRISGTVPPCFSNLTAMIQKGTEITEHYYHSTSGEFAPTASYVDNALASWKGQVFEYGRNFAYLKMIDLSTNELTGEIPIGITKLVDLKGLNLSSNKFYGDVPLDIGRLKMLESLDLGRNNFSGEIPQSMSGLHFLGYLDLSYNNLSGRIPSGTQLQGFNVSVYEGNVGLCGSPLKKLCVGDEADVEVEPSSDENDADEDEIEYKRWLYISATLGFGTTFWGICGILVLNRPLRRAYFLFLNNLKDRIYVIMAVRVARLRR